MRPKDRKRRSRRYRMWLGGWSVNYSATVLPSATGGERDLRLRMVKGRLGSMRFGFRSVVGFGAPTGEEGDGASAVVPDGRSCDTVASDP